jgi:hypothetical protein
MKMSFVDRGGGVIEVGKRILSFWVCLLLSPPPNLSQWINLKVGKLKEKKANNSKSLI